MGDAPLLHIALVEDDDAIAAAFVRLFALTGMHAQRFRSAEDLLAAAGPRCHCYVIDVQLPGMSGLDLQRRLQAGTPRPPVVLITACHDVALEIRRDRSSTPPDALLVKPFAGRLLADTVRCVASRF
jgi:FixJ family two-component response regulator